MRCKVGDVVMIRSKVIAKHNGKVGRIVEASPQFPSAWLIEPQITEGILALHWADESLVPLRGGPGVDEMRLITPYPRRERAPR